MFRIKDNKVDWINEDHAICFWIHMKKFMLFLNCSGIILFQFAIVENIYSLCLCWVLFILCMTTKQLSMCDHQWLCTIYLQDTWILGMDLKVLTNHVYLYIIQNLKLWLLWITLNAFYKNPVVSRELHRCPPLL